MVVLMMICFWRAARALHQYLDAGSTFEFLAPYDCHLLSVDTEVIAATAKKAAGGFSQPP